MPDSAADPRPRLWAPWRIEYVSSLGEHGKGSVKESATGCFFCDACACRRADGSFDEQLADEMMVLVCDERGLMLMNRYPYSNGHILIAPHAHVPALKDLGAVERAGLMELAELATRLQETALGTHGANIGINMGRCAGAGVPGHLHMHVVPRWHGDISFMEVTAGVKVIPQALETSYAKLKEALRELR
ncbi:MAG: HIT domain-containing protein [Planctomycetota bacterium]